MGELVLILVTVSVVRRPSVVIPLLPMVVIKPLTQTSKYPISTTTNLYVKRETKSRLFQQWFSWIKIMRPDLREVDVCAQMGG